MTALSIAPVALLVTAALAGVAVGFWLGVASTTRLLHKRTVAYFRRQGMNDGAAARHAREVLE